MYTTTSRGAAKAQQQNPVSLLRCVNLLFISGFLSLCFAAFLLFSGWTLTPISISPTAGSPQLDLIQLNNTLFSEAARDDPWPPEELRRSQILLSNSHEHEHHHKVQDVEFVRGRWQRAGGGELTRNHPQSRGRSSFPLELSHPRYSIHWAAASHTLRSWLSGKRFEPSIMNQLVTRLTNTSTRFKSCAVVGNSGILLENTHGELIDRHEVVIRINNARVSGFERHVGSRTSFSFINSNVLAACSRRPGCGCNPYNRRVPTIVYMCQALHFVPLKLCSSFFASDRVLITVTDPRLDTLCMRIIKWYSLRRFLLTSRDAALGDLVMEWKRLHDGGFFHYSSGMQAVVTSLGICQRVSLFGFGKSPTAKHHYHTSQKNELDLHDYGAEYELYQDLAGNKSITFLQQSGLILPAVEIFT